MARVREVWSTNLEQEMALIRETIEKYPYIAMVSLSCRHLPAHHQVNANTSYLEGHRVPWGRREAYRELQNIFRLSLSDYEV